MVVERTFDIRYETEVKLTTQDIDDVMVAALEGGINYWCRKAEVLGEYRGEFASEQISRGGKLRLYDAESSETWLLTRDKFLEGVKRWLTNGMDIDHGVCEGKLDTCVIDGVQADCIIQYALFGKVVFG